MIRRRVARRRHPAPPHRPPRRPHRRPHRRWTIIRAPEHPRRRSIGPC